MEIEDKIKRLCDGMGTYFDCHLTMSEAFGYTHEHTVFNDLCTIMQNDEIVRAVKNIIFDFILEELDFIKDFHDDNFEFLIKNSGDVFKMTDAIYDCDADKAIGHWRILVNELTKNG